MEQAELAAHCQAFELELRKGKKRRANDGSTSAPAEANLRYVHTEPKDQSVHTGKTTLYNGSARSVHTAPNKEAELSETELASAGAESQLKQAVQETLHRSRVETVGGKKLDGQTVDNLCTHLEALRDHPKQVIDVLDVLEERCRWLAKHPSEAEGKTWGWVVGVVRGEVKNRVGEGPDLKDAIRAAAAAKGMR